MFITFLTIFNTVILGYIIYIVKSIEKEHDTLFDNDNILEKRIDNIEDNVEGYSILDFPLEE